MKITVEVTYQTTQTATYKGVQIKGVESERKFKGIKCLMLEIETADYKVETFWIPKLLRPIFYLHSRERLNAIVKKQLTKNKLREVE